MDWEFVLKTGPFLSQSVCERYRQCYPYICLLEPIYLRGAGYVSPYICLFSLSIILSWLCF